MTDWKFQVITTINTAVTTVPYSLTHWRDERPTIRRKSPHHYSVDCARAHKGLFVGILILVLTIISLILFFVLISRPELVSLAVTEVNVCELTLYGMSTLATLIGMFQMRKLRYDGGRNLELDNILLVAAQTGMFIYSTFTIIGGHFTLQKHTVLVLVTALASVVQTTCQTIFILDASRRSVATAEQIRRKPGREIVTFLLVTNLAMWAINTLEKSRAESHPVQLHFYGLWAWTIITHVSMPLAIFYRFHSTVCLCEVWKRAYKVKPTYMWRRGSREVVWKTAGAPQRLCKSLQRLDAIAENDPAYFIWSRKAASRASRRPRRQNDRLSRPGGVQSADDRWYLHVDRTVLDVRPRDLRDATNLYACHYAYYKKFRQIPEYLEELTA